MLSRRRLLICLLTLGPVLLAGCQALRGPEPYGPTFVAPPGQVIRGGTVRAVPPLAGQYPASGQPPYQPPAYVPGSAPAYAPGSPPAYVPGSPPAYVPGSPPAYVPGSAPPSVPG